MIKNSKFQTYKITENSLLTKNKALGYLTNKMNKLQNIMLYKDITLIGKSKSSDIIIEVSIYKKKIKTKIILIILNIFS